jgi:hypothetical protein
LLQNIQQFKYRIPRRKSENLSNLAFLTHQKAKTPSHYFDELLNLIRDIRSSEKYFGVKSVIYKQPALIPMVKRKPVCSFLLKA